MDYLLFCRDWGYAITQTVFVRIPLERRWDDILEFFNHDEKSTVVTGKTLLNNFDAVGFCLMDFLLLSHNISLACFLLFCTKILL